MEGEKKSQTTQGVFSDLINHEKKLEKKLALECDKKEKSVFETSQKFSKANDDAYEQGKKDAASQVKKNTDKAHKSAEKKAAELLKQQKLLEGHYKKRKKDILKTVVERMFEVQ